MSQLHHTSARLRLWQNDRNCLAARIILRLLDRRKLVYRLKKQLHQIVQNPSFGFKIINHIINKLISLISKFIEKVNFSKIKIHRKISFLEDQHLWKKVISPKRRLSEIQES